MSERLRWPYTEAEKKTLGDQSSACSRTTWAAGRRLRASPAELVRPRGGRGGECDMRRDGVDIVFVILALMSCLAGLKTHQPAGAVNFSQHVAAVFDASAAPRLPPLRPQGSFVMKPTTSTVEQRPNSDQRRTPQLIDLGKQRTKMNKEGGSNERK